MVTAEAELPVRRYEGLKLVISGNGMTTPTVRLAVLLAGFGSVCVAVTLAVVVWLPAVEAMMVALTVILTITPQARLPIVQVTVPLALTQKPLVVVAAPKAKPLGSV